MPRDPINTAYARALLELAQAENAVSRIEEELFQLRQLLKKNPELLAFLKDPNIKAEGKRQTLAELFQGRVHPLMLNFLLTLGDLERANRLLAIIEEFSAAASAARQKVSGELITAVLLDDSTVQRIAAELTRLTGKNVELYQRVDPSILGGAIIKVGDQVLDGSLRRKLNEIRQKLTQ
jgi:F-type H+-transporting ATPase subunit delta